MRVLAAVLAAVWGFRLGLYLLFDRVLGKEEDGRYLRLRRKWGAHANRHFFWFFQFQAAAVVLFSLPFALVAQDGEEPASPCGWGSRSGSLGNAGAVAADRQLARWRGDPANGGKTDACRPLVVVAASELLLRVADVVRCRARRHDVALGLDRVDRPRRPALPALPRYGDPGYRGPGHAEPR